MFSGTFQGQWLRGLRHGYGIRSSAPFSAASVQRKKSLHSQPTIDAETIMEEELVSQHVWYHAAALAYLVEESKSSQSIRIQAQNEMQR